MKKAICVIMAFLLIFLPVSHVNVMAYDQTRSGGATLVILEHEDFSEAEQIALNETITVLVPNVDEDGNPVNDVFDNHFYITLPEDGYIYGSYVDEIAQAEHCITIYDPEEEEIVRLDNWKLGLAAGTYYVKGWFVYNLPGLFKINYEPSNEWEKERNYDFDHATDIPHGIRMNAWMAEFDEEVFKFTLPSDGVLSLGLDYNKDSGDPEKTWSVDLFDASENMIAGDSGPDIRIDNIGLGTGTYYVSVELFCDDSSDYYYQLYWDYEATPYCETEINDDYDLADVIPVNQAILAESTHNLTVHGNRHDYKDYFLFTLPEPGPVSVSFTPDEDGEFSFGIQDSEKNWIWTYYDLSCAAGETVTTEKLGLAAGDYYLLPQPEWNVPYRFTINYEASDFWEKELNNECENATTILANTAMNGWLEEREGDCYTFTLTEPGYIDAELSYAYHDDEINQGREFVLSLLDSDREDMAVCGGRCEESSDTKTGVSINKIGLDPGTYYLSVWNNWVYEAADNYYTLRLAHTVTADYETEYNNDFESADPVELKHTYCAQKMLYNDSDYFRFEIPEEGRITLQAAAETVCELDFEIRNSDKEKIEYGRVLSEETGLSNTSDEIELAKGTYYLITWGWEKVPYTFSINFEPGQHVHTPGDIEIENETDATCEEDGSYDEVVYCTVCGEEISRTTITVPATGHDWDEPEWTWTGDDEAGYKPSVTFTCSNDSSHKHVIEDVDPEVVTIDPTSTTPGSKTYTASVTGPDGMEYTSEKVVVIPAESYTFKEPVYTWTQTDEGYLVNAVKECNEDPARNIIEEVTAAYTEKAAATCTAEGAGVYTAAFTNDAFETQIKEITIPATGHTPTIIAAVQPSCTETGLTSGSRCLICREVLKEQEVVPALGHDWDEGIVTKEATCAEEGIKTYTCKNNTSHSKTESIPKTAHSYGKDGCCTSCGEFKFTDVPATPAKLKYVSWAYENGIVTGTSETTFSPDASCTRVQFVMMLWKMNGSKTVSGVTNPFSDVTNGTKTCKAVLWALKEGIITEGARFNPNGSISRVQIVMMLWKMAGSPAVTGTNPFTDVSGGKTTQAVLWAYQNGITKGTSATTFAPNNNCTRLQLVTFLYKYNGIYKLV